MAISLREMSKTLSRACWIPISRKLGALRSDQLISPERDGYRADASFERLRSVFRHGLPPRRLKHLQGVDRGRAGLGGHEAEGVIGIWEHLGEAEDEGCGG